MLELRPSCEHCATPLPSESGDAMICTFECTFCVSCVETVLANVCPNCGGGFTPRPIRPARDWGRGNFLGNYPARTDPVHKPVDSATQADLVRRQGGLEPHER